MYKKVSVIHTIEQQMMTTRKENVTQRRRTKECSDNHSMIPNKEFDADSEQGINIKNHRGKEEEAEERKKREN